MRLAGLSVVATLIATCLLGQAAIQPPQATPVAAAPTTDEVRRAMGIPSTDRLRGQQDIVGFASNPEQMAATWRASAAPPEPESFGPLPAPGVGGLICPHDDYLYAGRVYRRVVPLVTARTVVLVGVFHRYRRFGAKDVLVFDAARRWRAPDGEVPPSPLRDEIVAALPAGDAVTSAVMHDSEHSLEAIVYWLRHLRPDLEIVPVIVPAARFERLAELSQRFANALATAMQNRGSQLGRDVAIVVSTDGVHYGTDFRYTPYGDGGVDAYVRACTRDRELLTGPLSGTVDAERVRSLYETFVDPAAPDTYRMTWCGRFSVPFGLLLLADTARGLGLPAPVGQPIAYGTSVGFPELPLREAGLGETAPANLHHWVSFPAVAFTVAAR
jgi:AmmeMemoRadiSam system protein B